MMSPRSLAVFALAAGLAGRSPQETSISIRSEAIIQLRASCAAIKTRLRIDAKTTLSKVWAPKDLIQESVYEIQETDPAKIDAGFESMIKKAKAIACLADGPVTREGSCMRFTWMQEGKSLKPLDLSAKE